MDEAKKLHSELTEMLRELVASSHQDIDSIDEMKQSSKALFKRFSRVMSTLNTLRAHLPRKQDEGQA